MAVQSNTIFKLLKEDHHNVKLLFKAMKTRKSDQDTIFSHISKELTIHMTGEEKLLYPVLKEKKPTHEKSLEGGEEHNYAKVVLNDLTGLNKEDERWHAKFSVLQEMVEHHIQEEEKELFKDARKVLSKAQSDEIGKRYREEKERMTGSME